MKQYMHFFYGFVFLHLTACGQQNNKTVEVEKSDIHDDSIRLNETINFDSTVIDTSSTGLTFYPVENYKLALSNADQLKKDCNKLLQNNSSNEDSIFNEIGKLFEAYLLNSIVPHWYGTPWEFSGYTNVPNEGAIACGYFVSTTLKHMKMPLNRYRLAQQGAYDEGRSLAIEQSQMEIIPFDTIFEYTAQMKNGLYFLGLDYHVGYLWMHNQVPYFLHSNYIDNKVMMEKAQYSPAFLSSTNYYIVPISRNKPLMKSWIKSTPIKIYLTP